MIRFDPVEHKYTNEKGKRYISVTQFLHHFIESFEDSKDFWLYYKTIQYLSDIPSSKIKKYDELLANRIGKKIFTNAEYNRIVRFALGECNKDAEVLLSYFNDDERLEIEFNSVYIDVSWKEKNEESKIKGTAFHNWKEDKQLKDELFRFKGLDINVHDGSREFKTLSNLEPGVYTELKLWNHEYEIAGTSDQVIILPEKIALIRDFKTNLEITVSNKYQNMKYPVSHLEDCHLSHYNLQLSIYGWMLEQFGYKVKYLEFEHFDLVKSGVGWDIVGNKVYQVPYRKKEVVDMLNHYRNELQVHI